MIQSALVLFFEFFFCLSLFLTHRRHVFAVKILNSICFTVGTWTLSEFKYSPCKTSTKICIETASVRVLLYLCEFVKAYANKNIDDWGASSVFFRLLYHFCSQQNKQRVSCWTVYKILWLQLQLREENVTVIRKEIVIISMPSIWIGLNGSCKYTK